ncbi:MAG: hypothetical protein J4F41_07455 [Alphaproteobacteria bacterium]|nr:hypothetical protein [Alphaproteobacteria bacterium]
MIARLYIRKFKSPDNVERMVGTVDTHVMSRISAVTASLLVYVPKDAPNHMVELWEYPDEDSMQWVRQSLQGATVIPDAMLPENDIHNLDLVMAHNADWD